MNISGALFDKLVVDNIFAIRATPLPHHQRILFFCNAICICTDIPTTLCISTNVIKIKYCYCLPIVGSLEVYHNSYLKFAPKRLHFRYASMRARMQLAILDHNENVNRLQAVTSDGNEHFFVVFFSIGWV